LYVLLVKIIPDNSIIVIVVKKTFLNNSLFSYKIKKIEDIKKYFIKFALSPITKEMKIVLIRI